MEEFRWCGAPVACRARHRRDRKSTRLNSSHSQISYAVFCLKKKKNTVRVNKHEIERKCCQIGGDAMLAQLEAGDKIGVDGALQLLVSMIDVRDDVGLYCEQR